VHEQSHVTDAFHLVYHEYMDKFNTHSRCAHLPYPKPCQFTQQDRLSQRLDRPRLLSFAISSTLSRNLHGMKLYSSTSLHQLRFVQQLRESCSSWWYIEAGIRIA
jgi:hypothetical protein